jgi:hypothetical protein
MKFATIAMLAVLLLGSLAPVNAADPTSVGQVVVSLIGGAAWNSAYTAGTCWGYLPMVGPLGISQTLFNGHIPGLFSDPEHPSMQTAYLMWVSDFETMTLPTPDGQAFTVVLVPSGTATIYYTATPASRDLTNVRDETTRASWGTPVATFTRHAGHLQTADNFASDTMVFWAELVSSKSFTIQGVQFNFRDLIPYGMTCFESGRNASTSEASTCVAAGEPAFMPSWQPMAAARRQ